MKASIKRSGSILAILTSISFGGRTQDIGLPSIVKGSTRTSIAENGQAQWRATGALNAARFDHSATLLQNGKVLVAGGFGAGKMLSSCEFYDPATGTWRVTGNIPRQRHAATLLKDGKILVAGSGEPVKGRYDGTTELYDPASGRWTLTGSLKVGRIHHTATLLPARLLELV